MGLMFHQGIIILNAYVAYPGLLHLAKRLQMEAENEGLHLAIKTNAEIFAFVQKSGTLFNETIPADFIIYLDKDPYIAQMLEMNGYRLFNHGESIRLCDDKMLTYLSLLDKGIKMPKTISAPLCYGNEENLSFIRHLEKELPFPFVAKTNYGSQGKGVSLIESHEQLVKHEMAIAHSPRLYQELIRGEKGSDYRLIVIGGKLFAAMKRRNTHGDFRSNIALGGTAETTTPPPSFQQMAEKAAAILKLDYCGVDILKNESGDPVLCEVNSNAFIDGIEKATKKNVAKAYIDHIIHEVY